MIVEIVYDAVLAAAMVLAALEYVHMLQLESYQGKMYLKWVWAHPALWVLFVIIGVIPMLLKAAYAMLATATPTAALICYIAADALFAAALVLMFVSWKKRPHKKPLAYTARVKRLIAALSIIALAAMLALSFGYGMTYQGVIGWAAYMLPFFLRYLPCILMPLFVLLGYLVTYPIEAAVKRFYLNDAKKKLMKRPELIRIGITGSFGKTSTKYALAAILSEKYSVLFTPGSFNTPMGVTRVIREKLNDSHQVFIAEMGARYKGDIRELCGLVKPRYGIITAIGRQHLETFGSLEGVISTKAELMDAIPEDGAIFLNGDNEYCRELYEATSLERKYLFGTEGEGLSMRACDISLTASGSVFTLAAADGEQTVCKTRLLGRHNIMNIAAAAACARSLGLTMEEIKSGIAKLKPVEHRLELIEGAVTVIDDAFNANPVGAAEALCVLKAFPGRRIIVTPGMVEQGDGEEALNREFGRQMAGSVDVAMIIGKTHADPICDGLIGAGFPQERLVRCDSLDEATARLPLYTEPGCAVLFENDLPDNYNE